MAAPQRPRRKADELLLARGPLHRERVLLEIAEHVLPGVAYRAGVAHRVTDDDDERYASRKVDPVIAGARKSAYWTMRNAIKRGAWIVQEDGLIRHRDWVPPVTDLPDPGGFVVPPLDEVATAVAGRDVLSSFTKWHWAAIILTHVEVNDGPGQPESMSKNAHTLSTYEFAALKVANVGSPNTVRKYHAIALAHWGRRLEPGETIQIPDMATWPWPRKEHPTPGDLPKPKPKAKQQQPKAPAFRVDDDPASIAGKFVAWHGDQAEAIIRAILAEAQKRTGTNRRNRLKVVTT